MHVSGYLFVVSVRFFSLLNAGERRAGLGAIVRNWKGEIMAAGIQSTDFHGNVEYAEAEAIYILELKWQ